MFAAKWLSLIDDLYEIDAWVGYNPSLTRNKHVWSFGPRMLARLSCTRVVPPPTPLQVAAGGHISRQSRDGNSPEVSGTQEVLSA
jgi:hypothetical protein